MNPFVVLPTYNEAPNIPILVRELFALGIEGLSIVVVDDNSPDGTALVARALMREYPALHVVVRTGRPGRGVAGIEGFRYALHHGATHVIEMDADRSHPARCVPALLAHAGSVDLVIGSRCVPGAINRRGNPIRNAISRIAAWYIRTALGVPVRDATSGFRCFSRHCLQRIDLDALRSVGPAIVQELLVAALEQGATISEIPIVFEERRSGRSHFTCRTAVLTLGEVTALAWRYRCCRNPAHRQKSQPEQPRTSASQRTPPA